MASISNFGWIIKIGRLAVSDVSPLDQNGKVDFKFSDRKAAMDVRRTKLTSLVLESSLMDGTPTTCKLISDFIFVMGRKLWTLTFPFVLL